MQMTRTTPLRLMILQLRQIRLTDASTFIVALFLSVLDAVLNLLGSENDACPTQIVWRQFDGNLVAWQNPNIVHSHFPRNMSQHYMSIFQLDPEGRIGQIFKNLALHLYNVVFCHSVCSVSWALSESEFRL